MGWKQIIIDVQNVINYAYKHFCSHLFVDQLHRKLVMLAERC